MHQAVEAEPELNVIWLCELADMSPQNYYARRSAWRRQEADAQLVLELARAERAHQPHCCWSSYPLYLLCPEGRPPWLRTDRLLGEWGIPRDSAAGRQQFARHMEARRKAEQTGDLSALLRGSCLGSEQFRRELLLEMTTVRGSKLAGPEWRETAGKKAERILAEGLQRRGWDVQRLEHLRKADREKLKIAARLRAETTVTFKWITEHLSMGVPGYVSDCLRTAKH